MRIPLAPSLKFALALVSAATLHASFARAAAPALGAPSGAHLVFLVSSPDDANSYESARTIPPFAGMLQRQHGYRTTVLTSRMPESASGFPNIQAVAEADLLVVFCRRLGLPPEQLTTIKNHLNAGRPVVGLRTANHAFSVRGTFTPGHFAWWEFVADVLGAENRGYGPAAPGTAVSVVPAVRTHPIVRGLPADWHSKGNLYLTAPLLDRRATVLLTGMVAERVEPIAWTRMAGESRVFYTSLGHPADFDESQPHFRTLLLNGIRWALGKN
jgi:hypothetical protein